MKDVVLILMSITFKYTNTPVKAQKPPLMADWLFVFAALHTMLEYPTLKVWLTGTDAQITKVHFGHETPNLIHTPPDSQIRCWNLRTDLSKCGS